MKVITISREYGAGGHSIGKQVAEKLGIQFYDRDIVRETAKASGFDTELIENEEEDVTKTDSILKSICSASSTYFHDTQEVIHDVQQAIILRFAQEGPCVILGRCADEILRKNGIDSLNVFIHADEIHRAVRVSQLTGITDATEIQRLMTKRDSSRHTYYSRYTGKKWGDSRNYHLSLDSGILGYELCTRFIMEAAQAE
ncbi:Cytidylate kinase [Oscillibacter sp. PC13]|uniref:cytidylate kinase-like family protein n=1 Tax=Oscillibacter sp. PC13 TaxID=1855299 RepID=UPI0008DEE08C|nr:cytidylate kinase-like family protein [Oscillibacter sp. PC13]SFP20929.1 Cytidylate kinase [Oscillibacter sp. PC13]